MKDKDKITIGMTVIYYDVIKDNGDCFYPELAIVNSEPWQLGSGVWVCKLKNRSGGYDISHMFEVTNQNISLAILKGMDTKDLKV